MLTNNDVMIVVANHGAARFLSGNHDHGLQEVATLFCPEARLLSRELASDKPSHVHDSTGEGRHSREPGTRIKDKITRQFGEQIADRLEKDRNRQAYKKLVLVAPSDFLGVLHGSLSKQCRKLIVNECHHNMVKEDIGKIVAVLPHSIQAAVKKKRPLEA